jgi:ribonuclease T1
VSDKSSAAIGTQRTALAGHAGLARRFRALALPALCALASVGLLGVSPAQARKPDAPGEPVLPLATLPVEGQKTYQLILSGGPFPYDKDGVVFGNRERLLPSKNRGYYREYTVKTPGSRSRGARRIVCGGKEPKVPDLCYYTADHYASFTRIAP